MEPTASETQANVEFEDKIRGLLLRPYIVKHTTAKEDEPSTSVAQGKPDACENPDDDGGATKAEGKEGDVEDSGTPGCDSVLKDQNISLLYHGLSYTQNIKRYLLTCGSDTANDLQSMSESTSELEGMDVSLPLPHLESCASSTKALVSEVEPREEIMSPHHEPEALLHDFDIDTGPEMQETPKGEIENLTGDGPQKLPCKTMIMTEENLKNHQKNEMKLYIERMIQEKASLILTQYHSRLKRSHYPGSDHRPAKYQIMNTAGDSNFPRPPTVVDGSPTSPASVGQRSAGFPYSNMLCGAQSSYYTYMPYPLKSEHQAATSAAGPWKRTLELLPTEAASHRHAWAYRHKNKRIFKNSTTSSESSGMSWLTGTSSHNQSNTKCSKTDNSGKVMQDPFWRESISWSEELELRYSCPLRMVTTKGMRSSLRKLTTPKLIKRQLEEIAQNDTDSTPNMSASPERKTPDEASSGGRESPPVASNSNASLSGESDSNSNEKSENGSGESNSLISASYTSGENSSSMKESDDMSHENEIETGSKSDKMFIPVKKSHGIGKAPFWVQTISQSGLGFQQSGTLFESNSAGSSRPMFVISHQPDGVLQQLQELISEIHCFNTSDMSSTDSEDKKSQDYDFVTEVKASMPPEKNNESSTMGDSGFGTSCNGNGSSTKQGSSCSNVSAGDSGSEKKDIDGCGTSISSDKDSGSGNEVEAKEPGSDSGKSDDPILEMDSYQIAQDYDRLVGDLDEAIKSQVHCEENRKLRDRNDRKLHSGARTPEACQCEANLKAAKARQPQLTGIQSTEAQLTKVQLTETQIRNTHMTEEQVIGTQKTEPQMTETQISEEQLIRAQLTESRITDTQTTALHLTAEQLTEAQLTAAQITDTQMTELHLTEKQLTEAQLTEAHLTADQLTESQMTDSPMTVPHMTETLLTEEQLTETQLAEAQLTEDTEDMSVSTTSDSGKKDLSSERDSKPKGNHLDPEEREDMSITDNSDDGKKTPDDDMSLGTGSENSGSENNDNNVKKHGNGSPDSEKSRMKKKSPEKKGTDSDYVFISMDSVPNQPVNLDESVLSSSCSYGHRNSDIIEPVTESDINEYWSLLFTHSDDFISLLYL